MTSPNLCHAAKRPDVSVHRHINGDLHDPKPPAPARYAVNEEFNLNNYEEGDDVALVGSLTLCISQEGYLVAKSNAGSKRLVFTEQQLQNGQTRIVAMVDGFVIHLLGSAEVERMDSRGHAYGGTLFDLMVENQETFRLSGRGDIDYSLLLDDL